MGVAMLGALLTTLLTYLALSPRMLARMGMGNSNFPLRVREFVGYTVACMFLTIGFFLAGVPLGEPVTQTAVTVIITATPPPATSTTAVSETPVNDDLLQFSDELQPLDEESNSVTTGDSGSFGGPPVVDTQTPTAEEATSAANADPDEPTATAVDESLSEDEVEETAVSSPTPSPTSTRTAPLTPTPTQTPTATPTPSPEPTQTPVPPLGETAVIDTGGSTLWVRQTPGGRTLYLLNNGDTVVLSDGVANWQGSVWQEVRTLEGTLGWVQLEFLVK